MIDPEAVHHTIYNSINQSTIYYRKVLKVKSTSLSNYINDLLKAVPWYSLNDHVNTTLYEYALLK